MRIAVKKLRYTLEDFEDMYGGRFKNIRAVCVKIQGSLGLIHDYDVWIDILSKIFEDPPAENVKKTAYGLLNKFSRRRGRLYDDFIDLWTRLRDQNVWNNLVGTIFSSSIKK